MNFLDFKGNEELKLRLSDTVDQGSISHAYMIWGPEGSGKEQLAEALAAAMVCSGSGDKPCLKCRHCNKSLKRIHPDIIRVDKEADKKEIYVGQIREIVRDSFVLPNEADKKVYIILDADDMNSFAQNAILKLLEEPPSHAAFILIGTNPGNFLQTIRSRCIELQTVLSPGGSQGDDRDSTTYELADSIFRAFKAGDKLLLLSSTVKAEKLDKNQMASLLDELYLISADALKTEGDAFNRERIFKVLDLLKSLAPMRRFNVGTGHIAGMLTAKLNMI